MRFLGLLVTAMLVFVLLPMGASAQTLAGLLSDASGKPLASAQIVNVHTSVLSSPDSTGHFTIGATPGQLVEFRSTGYETARLRVPEGALPAQFSVRLRKEEPLPSDDNNFTPAQRDSMNARDVFQRALAFEKLTGYRAVQSPFSALSKRNRRIWRFQEEFEFFEEQKYIDRVFNQTLITSITGLTGDTAMAYARAYRPRYEQLVAMGQKELRDYIRKTGEIWVRKERARRAVIRSSQ